jgi:clan AA aspartic protease (TIGR02281 family)
MDMSKLRSVLILLLPLIPISLLPIIAAAQTSLLPSCPPTCTTRDQAKVAFDSVRSELLALCAREELQPHFSKSPCNPEDTTLEQMADKSRITNAEKVALSNAHTEAKRLVDKMVDVLRQYNPQLALSIKAERVKLDKVTVDFYEGRITRGEYNKRRMEASNNITDLAAPKTPPVALKRDGGIFVVPVEINGAITLDFGVDSGASVVTVPADVFSTLTRTGTIKDSDITGKQQYVLADGSTSQSFTFTIRSLKVGNNVVQNVPASVAPARADLLLGQSFLERFKSWSIDNTKHELHLERQ